MNVPPNCESQAGSVSSVKIAHVTTIALSLRYLLLNQLLSLQQVGYEIVAISSLGPDVSVLTVVGIRHIPVAMTRRFTPLADLISLWRLYRVMHHERFTIVHTHTPKPGFLGQLAARMAGVPIVINTLRGFYFHDKVSPIQRQFYRALEKIVVHCSDIVLSQNSEDIQTAVHEGICSEQQIRFLGNGIDLKRFDRNTIDADLLEQQRRELGFQPATPVIGFVGRLVIEKGILELLQAARIVLKAVPNARFLIVGPIDRDKSDAITPEIVYNYNVGDACVFTGMRDDMPELYALMDVFVLPSHREGFPRAPMEASAMGVPSVVTDIRGCREVIEHSRNGLLVPLGDVQALANAIIEILMDTDKARRMGEAARRIALDRFDERVVFEKVASEYAQLLLKRGLTVPVPSVFSEVVDA